MTPFKWACALSIAIGATSIVDAQTCPGYDNSASYEPSAQDTTQHTGSYPSFHNLAGTFSASCQYSAAAGGECAPTCDVGTTADVLELGATGANHHVGAWQSADGRAQASGGAVTCGGVAAGGVRSCLTAVYLVMGCNMSVGISVSASGVGGSVSYSASPLWDKTLNYSYTCPARYVSNPGGGAGTCSPTGSAPYVPNGTGAEYVWNSATCSWQLEPCNVAGCDSPILLDTDGSGFQLSSAAKGVKFDFFANGHPVQIAWPASGSKNGWLALPVNGKVENAAQLFGNITSQPPSKDRNGFAALAVYDTTPNGGNGDGVISKLDAIWTKLRVWIDANHDGVSQPEELYTLDQVGIHKIDLKYGESPYVDAYGNHFRYKGRLADDQGADVNRTIYDVFLVTGK